MRSLITFYEVESIEFNLISGDQINNPTGLPHNIGKHDAVQTTSNTDPLISFGLHNSHVKIKLNVRNENAIDPSLWLCSNITEK